MHLHDSIKQAEEEFRTAKQALENKARKEREDYEQRILNMKAEMCRVEEEVTRAQHSSAVPYENTAGIHPEATERPGVYMERRKGEHATRHG